MLSYSFIMSAKPRRIDHGCQRRGLPGDHLRSRSARHNLSRHSVQVMPDSGDRSARQRDGNDQKTSAAGGLRDRYVVLRSMLGILAVVGNDRRRLGVVGSDLL